MKKVLLICYYFPPLGGVGIGRPLALFKQLPEHGYECHVLTVKPVAYRMYEPDALRGLDTGRIYRAGSRDPQRLMYLLGIRRVKGSLIERSRKVSRRFFPDPKVGWVRPAVNLGRSLLAAHNYDAIMSTSPPISCHLVARQLAAEFGCRWLADFRDFWTLSKLEDWFDDEQLVRRGTDLLRDIGDTASCVTAVNPSCAAYVRANEVVFNGYDRDLAQHWRRPTGTDEYLVGLMGTFGEPTWPVRPLLNLLAGLKATAPSLADKVGLVQVGQVDRQWLTGELEPHSLLQRCSMHPYRPREEAVRLLSRAHAFYVGFGSSREAGVLPARIFDMLASGRPIIAAVPKDSEVHRLIRETNSGIRFDDATLMPAVAYLSGDVQQVLSGERKIRPIPDYAVPYSSDAMVRRFAELLDGLYVRRPTL